MSLQIALKRIEDCLKYQTTSLNLDLLNLEEIPAEIAKLKHLRELDLSRNQLIEIKCLEQLTELTLLELSGNQLTEIKGLEQLSELTELSLPFNLIKEIKGLEQLRKLTLLDLTDNRISEIRNLEKLTELTELWLNSNQFSEIKGLERLTKLNLLNLAENQLSEIVGLEKLTQLTSLDLSYNRLTEIKGLEQLSKLTILILSSNQITEIKGLNRLSELTALELKSNQLTEIRGLEQLSKLSLLELDHNQIIELPEELLERNLPIWLKIRPSVDVSGSVFVAGNPFKIPPPEVIMQGNTAIRNYFDQRKKSGEELLLEAKLILLGDGRSGKTSLANRLLGKELPAEEDRTQGVSIGVGEYRFDVPGGAAFKLNIWDFAGQDKYKALHQLFYTESSLYVMVAESGNVSTDFNDWLETAKLFGEKSPLLVVLNEFKKGIGMGSFDSEYWKKQFPELLKEVITVNLGTKENFQKAEEYIQFFAQTLPHTKYPFPSNWAAIRSELNKRRKEHFISLKEYLTICKNNQLLERESALILSSVLHKIGDCLHYQQSELLNQLIILNNEWATDAVYKILDDQKIAEVKCGFFDQNDLQRIWDKGEYQDMRPQLLELMKQFRLAYQLPGKEEYVTPPLLPPVRPVNYEWPDTDALELYIEYDFLPKALLTQFIVSRHTDIAENRTLVWRNGVVLDWSNEALAEVSRTKLKGKDAIFIRSQGSNRKGLMTVILKTLRELHSEYSGISCQEKVPCACKGCTAGENKQYYFSYAYLKRAREKGRNEVECHESLETQNVWALLENTFVFERREKGEPLSFKIDVPRQHKPEVRVLKLFIASSSELKPEREKIEQSLSRKADAYRERGFKVKLLIWENSKWIGSSFRSQDNYDKDVKECDFFALLFHSKVGKFSFEEFREAKSRFVDMGNPRIVVFKKDVPLPTNQSREDAESRFDFIELLGENEHFTVDFKNADVLINDLEDVIDKLMRDKEFVTSLEIE